MTEAHYEYCRERGAEIEFSRRMNFTLKDRTSVLQAWGANRMAASLFRNSMHANAVYWLLMEALPALGCARLPQLVPRLR
jgi:hypothetical protein